MEQPDERAKQLAREMLDQFDRLDLLGRFANSQEDAREWPSFDMSGGCSLYRTFVTGATRSQP